MPFRLGSIDYVLNLTNQALKPLRVRMKKTAEKSIPHKRVREREFGRKEKIKLAKGWGW